MSIEKKLHRSGPYSDLFCQGVQVGGTLYLAGQVGTDDNGQAPDSLLEQMTLAYGHVKEVLSTFDATMDNLVDETWFVTDIDECIGAVETVRRAPSHLWENEVGQTLVRVIA